MDTNCPQDCTKACDKETAVLFGFIGGLGILFEICLVCYLSKNCRRKDSHVEKDEDLQRQKFKKYFDEHHLTLLPCNVEIGQTRLGVGQFAEVCKGTARFHEKSTAPHMYADRLQAVRAENVAIKITFAGKGAEIKLMEEAMRLHEIRHKHIITMKGVCIRSLNGPLMIMELLEGNLETYLELTRNEMRPPISLLHAVRIMCQVAEAVSHLQSHDIIHRDLAARNILLTSMKNISEAQIKLADFGLARIIPHEEETYQVQDSFLPVTLVPPEVFKTDQFCLKSDVWGFAVFAWEFLMVGIPPNQGKSAIQIRDCVLSPYESIRCLPQPSSCPDLLYVLLKMCWALNPEERPSFLQENEANSGEVPAITTILSVISNMLDRQSSGDIVYLSPTIKEEADQVFPLPLSETLNRPSDLISADSGYGGSANTRNYLRNDSVAYLKSIWNNIQDATKIVSKNRHSEQFDPAVGDHRKQRHSFIATSSPMEPPADGNYLKKLDIRQRMNSLTDSGYEIPRTKSRSGSGSLPKTSPLVSPTTSPNISIISKQSSVFSNSESSKGTTPCNKERYEFLNLCESGGLNLTNHEEIATSTVPRYENWYYTQQTLKLPDDDDASRQKPPVPLKRLSLQPRELQNLSAQNLNLEKNSLV